MSTLRTVAEIAAAGARAGAEAPPYTAEQITRIALLLAPYRTASEAAA